jgi:hypothetical protein
MPNLCKCGCLRPCEGEYFNRHSRGNFKHRRRSLVDYVVEDRGYKTPCWIWQLKITCWGYGQITVNRHCFNAHRYYYEQYKGPIPKIIDGQRAEPDHLCRVRACVNPEHLEVVTRTENVRRGLNAKLSKEAVVEIAPRYLAGESQSQIARSLGIGQTEVNLILRGMRWLGVAVAVPLRAYRGEGG